jgi:molecular chaperone HscB
MRLRDFFYCLMDYFSVFGLEPKLTIDAEDLQARFYKLSRENHPDKFARQSAEIQQRALETTSLLNDGLRVLKDPVRRAEYMLTRNGLEVAEQRGKDVPPELLEEVFELNEALEELRSGDDSARSAIEDAQANFISIRAEIDEELIDLFSEYDQTQDPAVLSRMRGILNRRRYIENLIGEATKTLKA